MNKKIRFGILCNSYEFESWEVACIQHLMKHTEIELQLLVMKEPEESIPPSFFQKLQQYPYRNFLYRFYKRYWLKASSYKRISLASELKHVAVIKCATTRKGKFDEYFKETAIAEIKLHQLDFMLRFGFNIIKGSILNSCTYGIWSFHHADNDFIRGGPIGFWEIFLKRNTTAAILQQLNETLDGGRILRKGYLKTVEHSMAENIDQLTDMAAIWPLQVCIDLLHNQELTSQTSNVKAQAKLYKYPTNGRFLRFIFILWHNKIKFHLRQLFVAESWQIARFAGDFEATLKLTEQKPAYLSKASAETYAADPFLWPLPEQELILFEHYCYQQQTGRIAMSNFDGSEFKFLDFGVEKHMSYPFCFSLNQQVYCLPEQADTKEVSLYQLQASGMINKVKVLIHDFAARDSSIVFYNNKWWLFCTKANYFENAALFIFYSNDLDNAFTPHSNNPVKIDVQNARPAGPLFVKNGELFRPAQNSAKHYGHQVNINKIITLNEHTFQEEIVSVIAPERFGKYSGIHHIASFHHQTVIDLKRSQFSLHNFKFQIVRKLRKTFS